MIYIGIDPGLSGAIAWISADAAGVIDTPTSARSVRGKARREFCEVGMASLLRDLCPAGDAVVAIERGGARPGQGVASSYLTGYGVGLWAGLASGWCSMLQVLPIVWKREFSLIGQPKQASVPEAARLFPALSEQLRLKAHAGRADALLIAEWCRRKVSPTIAPLKTHESLAGGFLPRLEWVE